MLVKKISNARIIIQGNEHNPPHVHVVSPDGNAQINLVKVKVMAGTLPSGREQKILDFIEKNRDSLIEEFYQKNPLLRRPR